MSPCEQSGSLFSPKHTNSGPKTDQSLDLPDLAPSGYCTAAEKSETANRAYFTQKKQTLDPVRANRLEEFRTQITQTKVDREGLQRLKNMIDFQDSSSDSTDNLPIELPLQLTPQDRKQILKSLRPTLDLAQRPTLEDTITEAMHIPPIPLVSPRVKKSPFAGTQTSRSPKPI